MLFFAPPSLDQPHLISIDMMLVARLSVPMKPIASTVITVIDDADAVALNVLFSIPPLLL